MTEQGELFFLGTGGSMGIPVIGCHCAVCQSTSKYNKRLRPSALLRVGHKTILIDSGPDLRYQALKYRVDHLDGVIITHAHHDHTAGIDDLRVYYMHSRRSLPCLMSRETADELEPRYSYIFQSDPSAKKLISRLERHYFPEDRGEITFLDFPFRYMTYQQAGMSVNGFCLGNLAFISDIREYPETIFEDLQGVEVLVLSALRFERSYLHFSINEAIEFSQKVGAKETWLTHIAHEVDHESANALLPPEVQLAYDGLSIRFKFEIS